VIIIGILGLAVTLVVVLIRTTPHGPKPFVVMSLLPLLLTILAPVPLGLVSRSPTDWARQAAVAISRVGIALSVVLFVIGVVLTVRAVKSGDRRSARLFAFQTILAAMPAGLFTISAAMFRFL